MPRFRLDIEYDGTPYSGWQRQAGQHSVQAAIEQAVLAFSGETVTLKGAGRTDTGVHATGQVAHVDLTRDWRADKVRDAVNAHLKLAGETVAVLSAAAVDENFDARFSARARHYLYRILTRKAPPALERHRAWWLPVTLDAEAMEKAAKGLLGHHDFTTFRSSQCQARSPLRTLDRLDVVRAGDLIEIRTSARAFLHNQVRSMVGTLKRVGEGAWSAEDVRSALEARDRAACAALAPPSGLYLERVDYPVPDLPQGIGSGIVTPNSF